MEFTVQIAVRLLAVLVVAAGALLAAPQLRAGDEVFVPGFDDLPLASGLVGGEDGVMVFDTPGGRIVEARVAGPGKPEDVMAFYEQTLPQLGWTHLGKGRFAREGEILIVEAVAVAGGESPSVTVRFQLSPESR